MDKVIDNISMWNCIASLGIRPYKDGNMWSYLYGENIQEGIAGFGRTIFEAAQDFYENIKTETIKQW